MDRYRIIHICHLQQVLGASILLHLYGLPAPLLCPGVLRVFSVRWHLEVPTLENEFTYVIFILPVYKITKERENTQLILPSCKHFPPDFKRFTSRYKSWQGTKMLLEGPQFNILLQGKTQILGQIMLLRALCSGMWHLQGWRWHNLFEQPLPLPHCLLSEGVFSYTQSEPFMFPLMLIVSWMYVSSPESIKQQRKSRKKEEHGNPHSIQISKCLITAFPEKDLQGASLNDIKHPYTITILYDVLRWRFWFRAE